MTDFFNCNISSHYPTYNCTSSSSSNKDSTYNEFNYNSLKIAKNNQMYSEHYNDASYQANFSNAYLTDNSNHLLNVYKDVHNLSQANNTNFLYESSSPKTSKLDEKTSNKDSKQQGESLDSSNEDSGDAKIYPWMKKNHGCNDYGL